jgi:hypothetical protein
MFLQTKSGWTCSRKFFNFCNFYMTKAFMIQCGQESTLIEGRVWLYTPVFKLKLKDQMWNMYICRYRKYVLFPLILSTINDWF